MDGKKALPQSPMIERLERSFERLAADQQRLGTPATAVKKLAALRSIIDLAKGAPAATQRDVVSVTARDVEALLSFYEDAVDAIQLARYSVRFKSALTAEPVYPRETHAVAELLRRLIDELHRHEGG